MADVFEILGADHGELMELLAGLEAAAAAARVTRAERAESARLSRMLIAACSRHEAVEQQYVWPVVRDRVPRGPELAASARQQEAGELEWLARLADVAPGERSFDELLGKLIPATRDHLDYEEQLLWPPLRQALTTAEAEELGRKVTDGKKTAPDRPHPGGRVAGQR